MREHDFDGDFGACKSCGRYVEELLDQRYCGGSQPPEEVVEAARWQAWKDELMRVLCAKYSYTEGQASLAVRGVYAWRDYYDDGYLPEDAAYENESAGHA